ncbi:MAG TPA: hypothetical protein ENH62_05870 [Marinobacter sp.]|uniref:Uncharacterized protein n=1 Tax=marine sediment metagenome TaxID=412755 RepID=A0A0F9TMH2_9ZZZZ|nr:hypothetical protein [Marinobacter sp.]
MTNFDKIGVLILLLLLANGLALFLLRDTTPAMLVYFIQHEESGEEYRISRKVFASEALCGVGATMMNLYGDRPTIWMEGNSQAYILDYAECEVLTDHKDMSEDERQDINEKLAKQFIGG